MNINQNPNFGKHNTSVRIGGIKYIAIHYVGATGTAKGNVDYYNRTTATNASADFFVGHSGEIWQYNPNPEKRYCWAVGGGRQSQYGGSLHGKVKNNNSISIEMCVKTKGSFAANSPDWYFTEETIKATIELTKYLMDKYNIPVDRVVRHFDVTGKLCPGVVGWNYVTGSEKAWNDFKAKLTEDDKVLLVEDGVWGKATTSRLQQIFGTSVDGTVSNQWSCYKKQNPGLSGGWQWKYRPNGNGSQLIKALQKWAGMTKAEQDGEWGINTAKAIQRKLGTTVDGFVSYPSAMVKALQKWANEQ